jgi:aspartyl-tRNA(Asn)/glutamyl-tRNA(Gln) amidotransferase subunit A
VTLSPFATIAETRQALRERVASPVELAERILNRIATIGRGLNAVVTITPERARREARQAEVELASGHDRGPLHGVPYGAKDLLATAGDPTTWGAAPLRDQVFPGDAAVVERLSDAGAILAGKFAMSELAGGLDTDRAEATYTQPALNPWHRGAYCGGSTSGGSAAVAAGLIPYTIGSETWGSILVPAALTGLTGLRPTHGLVSRRGAMALSWTLDKLGPISHTAEDCAVVLAAIAGPDPGDPDQSGRSFTLPPAPANGRFRLGVLTDGVATMQPAVRDNFTTALTTLADVSELEEIALPDLPYAAVCWSIMVAEAASAFEDLIDSGRVAGLVAPENRIGGFVADLIPARSYIRALRVRRLIRDQLAALTASYDAIVTPTVGAVAPPLGVRFSEYYGQWGQSSLVAAGNVAGLPAITVPTGFGDRGLPTAMQFVAGPFAEAHLIHLAAAYQARTDWHQRHPAGLD